MAEQTLIQFRADRDLKNEVTDIFEELGMDMSTALRMFLVKSRQIKGLPFDVILSDQEAEKVRARNVLKKARKEMAAVPQMSMEEIDAEIQATRAERKAKNQ